MKLILLVILASPAFAEPIIYLNGTATNPWTATDDQKQQTLQIVKDAFAQFNVRVTMDFPGYLPDVVQVLMGGQFVDGAAGISGIGSWKAGTYYDQFNDQYVFAARVYADGLNNDPTLCGKAAVHEAGHNIGLNHQPDGYMYAYIDPNPATFFWSNADNVNGEPQHDVEFIAGQFNSPEPQQLSIPMMLLVYAMMRRARI